MAERVQQALEAFVPEIHELQKLEIFSAAELQRVVQMRTEFEYKLCKRQTLKQDYLDYIAYEVNLDRLRQKRKQSRNIKSNKLLTDYSIVQHCHRVFDRACTRFPADISLWCTAAAYASHSQSHHVTSRIYTRALLLNPQAVDLWLAACKYEWEQVRDPVAARVLFMRALRINSKSRDLWCEYLRMELAYGVTLFYRNQVMQSENSEDAIAIAQVVVQNALAAVTKSDFYVQLLAVVDQIGLKHSETLNFGQLRSLIAENMDEICHACVECETQCLQGLITAEAIGAALTRYQQLHHSQIADADKQVVEKMLKAFTKKLKQGV